ncbi:MAG TPA: hypothetical protein PLP73_04290, partial [Candidatus Absconditabacterales bacterium]|nr:hypothetical protein [Candidatus Absconditabacterales bacterium]
MEETIEIQKYEPVVATPLKDGEIAPILNEETYNTLKGMITSRDEGNHKMAQLILNTCDIQKSIYWIWKLARHGSQYNMVNLRTKASRSFRDKASLFHISHLNSTRFAKYIASKDWLTSEIYQRLEEEIVKEAALRVSNDFYDVELTIK